MKPHRREGSYWVTLDHFLISQEFLQSHQIGHAFRKFRSEKQLLDHFFTLFWKVDKNHTTLEKTYWRKRFWVSRISVSPLRLWHLFQKSHQMIVLKIDLLSGISILFFLYENRKKFETVEFRSRKLSSFQKKSSKIEPFWIISKLSTDNRHKKWWFCISLGFPRSPRPPKLFTNHFCGLSTVVKCNPDQFTKDMLHQIKQTISILVVSQQCKTLYWSNYQ